MDSTSIDDTNRVNEDLPDVIVAASHSPYSNIPSAWCTPMKCALWNGDIPFVVATGYDFYDRYSIPDMGRRVLFFTEPT
jgi:hypothetical protein